MCPRSCLETWKRNTYLRVAEQRKGTKKKEALRWTRTTFLQGIEKINDIRKTESGISRNRNSLFVEARRRRRRRNSIDDELATR